MKLCLEKIDMYPTFIVKFHLLANIMCAGTRASESYEGVKD